MAFRYCDADGQVTDATNPNGAIDNVAGIVNESGNVLGMMPHPERVCEDVLGGTDGRAIFQSMIDHVLAEDDARWRGQTICPRCGSKDSFIERVPAGHLCVPGVQEPAGLAGDPRLRPGLRSGEPEPRGPPRKPGVRRTQKPATSEWSLDG